jgi:hypothetical protein
VPLNNVYILFVLIVVVCAITFIERRRRIKARNSRQRLGLSWLQSLRVFLASIQRHRGLTTGYLSGSDSLMAEVVALQQKVGKDIGVIACIDPWMEENARWQAITQHWARLAGRFESNNVDNNMNQHNALIQNILYLIDDMAQEHDLLLLHSRNGTPLHLVWRELLLAAEYVGQARALGMGVVAAAHCDSVNRIRLKYLCQKVEENTGRVWRKIKPQGDSQTQVERLLLCISEDVIRNAPSISPADYFLTASSALDGLHEHYDKIVEDIKWHALG